MYGKELRRQIRHRAVRSLPAVLRILPETWGRELCAGVGRAGHLVVGRDRRLARANLARVFPEWPEDRVRREARRVFEEIGRNAFDFLRYPSLTPAEQGDLIRLEGRDHLDRARSEGRGAIVVTAHLGCWEILAAALVRAGYSLKALARPLREGRLDRGLNVHRKRMGVETISSDALPIQAIRHLRKGGFLGVLADQRIKRGGVLVDFLGQPTLMTDGPARLALASGAPLVPAGIRRGADHRHVVQILSPIPPGASGVRAPELTQRVAHSIEQLIRDAFEQWIWIHPRWEHRRNRGADNGRGPEPAAPGRKEDVCA